MSWQDDVDKKLGALLGNKPKDPYEDAADMLIEHAHCNVYRGPSTGGDTYSGWPIMELLKLAPLTQQVRVYEAFTRKFGHMSLYPPPQAPPSFPAAQAGSFNGRPHSLEEMMAMRMRWGALTSGAVAPWAVGFTHMAMHAAGDVVHIWIITKDGQSLVLEDEHGLYPSDTLITKIRLLQRGETT